MAQRQQKLVDVVLQDPAVDNVSSFIGVDGTNTTLNSGRIQITLKPLDVRKVSATEVIQRMQSKVNAVEGIQLFLQPLQDLTVEDRVSRTEYQYALEDPDQNGAGDYTRKMVTELSKESS
jgi:multidrug efflux pump